MRLFFNMKEGMFKHQAEYLANFLDKLTPEAEDKVRKQDGVSAAESQIEEVRKRYYGTDKWMKAPNGRDTNLTERQWLQVRTENFKRWFGDWELLSTIKEIFNADPVAELTGNEFAKIEGESLVDRVVKYYDSIGGEVKREGLGSVILSKKNVQSSVAHGIGRNKAIAFKAVPDVIKNGTIISRTENYKGRGYTSYVIDAPIRISGERYICEVVIKESKTSKNFYLHEVEKIRLQLDNQVRASEENSASHNVETKASKLIIGKLWDEVNGRTSLVADENGEPKPVYHGSRSPRFNIFDSSNGDAFAETPEGSIWFTDSKEVALSYSSKSEEGLYEVFLNIRNPESTDWGLKPWTEINEEGHVIYDVNEYVDEGMVAYGDTIDGFVIENIAEDDFNENSFSTDYVVFNPNQIKSATDNTGDFSTLDDDIRYQAMSLSDEQRKYVELKKNIVLNYSDETQYTNVFVYTEHYENYENGTYSKRQRAVYEKELRAAEVFGNAGFSVYVLPEKFILAGQEYKGRIPDALMNGYLVEFKELETTKVGQFQKELSNAAKKADILYLDSPVEMLEGKKNKQTLKNVINGIIKNSNNQYEGKIIVTSVRGENPTTYTTKNGALEEAPLTRLRLEPQPNTNISRLNNIVKNEVMREQDSATPLRQTIEGTTKPERITSSFKFDTDTGKYYISGGVYDEIVEVMNSSFPIENSES